MKARIGEVTRKYFGSENTTTKSASSYRINMSECKSFVEISPGEIVSTEDYEDMKLAVELLSAQIKALSVWISFR